MKVKRVIYGGIVGAFTGALAGYLIVSVDPSISFWPFLWRCLGLSMIGNVIVMTALVRLGAVTR